MKPRRQRTLQWLQHCRSIHASTWGSKMSTSEDHALPASIFDDSVQLTLQELSRMCAIDERLIVEFVEEGVLTAVSVAPQWHFNGGALRRARLAVRLQRDLEINLA